MVVGGVQLAVKGEGWLRVRGRPTHPADGQMDSREEDAASEPKLTSKGPEKGGVQAERSLWGTVQIPALKNCKDQGSSVLWDPRAQIKGETSSVLAQTHQRRVTHQLDACYSCQNRSV